MKCIICDRLDGYGFFLEDKFICKLCKNKLDKLI